MTKYTINIIKQFGGDYVIECLEEKHIKALAFATTYKLANIKAWNMEKEWNGIQPPIGYNLI